MLKMLSTWGAVLMAMIVLVSWGQGAAAVQQDAANFGQVDTGGPVEVQGTWHCPLSPIDAPIDTDVPGLQMSLGTQGGPVPLMLTFTFWGDVNAGFWLEPVIDGQQHHQDYVAWQNSIATVDAVAFQRIYPLLAGVHTIGWRIRCGNNTLILQRAWTTAYELPLVKTK
jgi:hypothetical protein